MAHAVLFDLSPLYVEESVVDMLASMTMDVDSDGEVVEDNEYPRLEEVVGLRACPLQDSEDLADLAKYGARLARLSNQLVKLSSRVSAALTNVRKQEMDLLVKLAQANQSRWEC